LRKVPQEQVNNEYSQLKAKKTQIKADERSQLRKDTSKSPTRLCYLYTHTEKKKINLFFYSGIEKSSQYYNCLHMEGINV